MKKGHPVAYFADWFDRACACSDISRDSSPQSDCATTEGTSGAQGEVATAILAVKTAPILLGVFG